MVRKTQADHRGRSPRLIRSEEIRQVTMALAPIDMAGTCLLTGMRLFLPVRQVPVADRHVDGHRMYTAARPGSAASGPLGADRCHDFTPRDTWPAKSRRPRGEIGRRQHSRVPIDTALTTRKA
ncbi:hypothetical protein BGLA2_810039 [Burkholderia gladioli]|nr:hypothetical protein BGLA2_810039 [Burkholderia gladioli]